jgi:glycosyl transferase family 87
MTSKSYISLIGQYCFHRDRLTASAIAFVLAYLAVASMWLRDGFQPVDFTAFWSASYLAINDAPITIFNAEKMAAAHLVAIPNSVEIYEWFYPPTFLLFVLPLALLPYALSYFIWTVSTYLALNLALVKFISARWAFLGLLAFPGVLMNALTGQNGLLIAALFTLACYTLDRRPILSGILIGLISIKPQFGVLWPIALLCGRHWSAFASATVSTVGLAVIALFVFDIELWVEFLKRVADVQQDIDGGLMDWIKAPTIYGSGRLLGLGVASSYMLHSVVAVGAIIMMGLVWTRRTPIEIRATLLALATLIVLPRLFFYDLALLALPIALMTGMGLKLGWRPYERPLLALAWLTPLIGLVLAIALKVHLTPIVLASLLIAAWQRSASKTKTAPGT